jgi:hypothetical protein
LVSHESVPEKVILTPEEAHGFACEHAWRDRRNRRRNFFAAWLGGLPTLLLIVAIFPRTSNAGYLVLFIAWAGAFFYTAIRWSSFRCPGCRERFVMKTWAWGLIGYHNPFTSHCLHCGLRVGEVPPFGEQPVKEKMWLAWWPPKVADGQLPAIFVASGRVLSLVSAGMLGMPLLQRLIMQARIDEDDLDALVRAMHSFGLRAGPICLLVGLFWWRAGVRMKTDVNEGKRLGRLASWLGLIGGVAYLYGWLAVLPFLLRVLPFADAASGPVAVLAPATVALVVVGYPAVLLSLCARNSEPKS